LLPAPTQCFADQSRSRGAEKHCAGPIGGGPTLTIIEWQRHCGGEFCMLSVVNIKGCYLRLPANFFTRREAEDQASEVEEGKK
jgi:hypothetical protein